MTRTAPDHADLARRLTALRRALHAAPETGLQLPRTQEAVLTALRDLDLEIHTGRRATSVTAVLRGARPGPPVLLRADMDALPMREAVDLPYASSNGAMHSCGHDLHTAALVGAAHLLAARRGTLAGDVVLMFQPGEESLDGARLMISEGVLEVCGRRPVAAYGLHVVSDLPHGVVVTRPGPLMAACGLLEVTVRGRGGHASRPHDTLDPVPVLAQTVTALHTYVDRRFAAADPVVLSVGELHAGSASNVVPDTGVLRAAVRTFSAATGDAVAAELPRLVTGIAEANGLTAEVAFTAEVPLTVNDPTEAAHLHDTAVALFGPARVLGAAAPVAASEDFAHVLAEVPGAYGFLGAAAPGADVTDLPVNHSAHATFDDGVLLDHARLLAELATRRLARSAPEARAGRRTPSPPPPPARSPSSSGSGSPRA
ncbi:M20 family metallopeptidase [Pseudonocardia sp. WMMC193]|uniref:M20 metallopeptidase family protein n=1 Tax=Pseudonocardia sp. WMMC193 TaxID=2911965 RepID=UPI001F1EA773|nr:M20 family metallopeptidase [Pseudonocardia sp. WMMC193]MCF7548195.1 M20 family metallopeptidase [Pseudonocardia sp. WMMC193]